MNTILLLTIVNIIVVVPMPHFGLIDDGMDPADEALLRAKLHVKGGNIRLARGELADAVASSGPENFDSQAIFYASKSFSLNTSIENSDTFDETKRTSINYLAIFEAQAETKDLIRITSEPIPVIREP